MSDFRHKCSMLDTIVQFGQAYSVQFSTIVSDSGPCCPMLDTAHWFWTLFVLLPYFRQFCQISEQVWFLRELSTQYPFRLRRFKSTNTFNIMTRPCQVTGIINFASIYQYALKSIRGLETAPSFFRHLHLKICSFRSIEFLGHPGDFFALV